MTIEKSSKKAKPSMKLLATKEAIIAGIASIKRRGISLDRDIHVAGCSCLDHIEQHGNPKLLNDLIAAMPKGSRVNALREWAEAFGRIKYNEETKLFEYDKKKVTLLEDAMLKAWTDFKPEQPYQPMDFNAEMVKVLKKAYARLSEDSKKGDKIDTAVLKQVAKIIEYKHEAA